MVRGAYIERILMQIYGQKVTDDAEITFNLVNLYLNDGIGVAAKTCYKEAVQLDGVAYVNNGFYCTFSGLIISADDTDNLCYKLTLPEIPTGIGRNEGMAELRIKDTNGFTSLPVIPVSINEWGYADSMRPIPNKILGLQEGNLVRMKTSLIMTDFTGTAKIISGGVASDLNSELIVPPDYFPVITQYIREQLILERSIPTDSVNDGQDSNLKQQ
jgi:hypothetical protein